jgi:hypothetical protein
METNIITFIESLVSYAMAIVCLWSVVQCIRLTLDEKNPSDKVKKLRPIRNLIRTHNFALFPLGIATVLFNTALWPVAVILTIHIAIQNTRLYKKVRKIADDMMDHHSSEAALALNFGVSQTAEGVETPIRLWFKRGTSSWPILELEVGAGIHCLPIENVPSKVLRQHVLPKIQEALDNPDCMGIFSQIHEDLLASGVSHPIDIKGWDKNPLVKELIEKIMQAPLPNPVT